MTPLHALVSICKLLWYVLMNILGWLLLIVLVIIVAQVYIGLSS